MFSCAQKHILLRYRLRGGGAFFSLIPIVVFLYFLYVVQFATYTTLCPNFLLQKFGTKFLCYCCWMSVSCDHMTRKYIMAAPEYLLLIPLYLIYIISTIPSINSLKLSIKSLIPYANYVRFRHLEIQ